MTDLAAGVQQDWEIMTAVDALLDAVERGDLAAARSLAFGSAIRSALAVNSRVRLEVLVCFALSGCPELASEALETVRREPQLAIARIGGSGTMLHRAASAWNVPLAELLLSLGSDPNARDYAGHPPLYHAGNRFPRPAGITDSSIRELIAHFVQAGADLDVADGVKRSTPLHMAARRGHAALAEALVAAGANIEARDSNGETPLRRAVNCSQPAVADVLLGLGADPDSPCSRRRTPREAARTEAMRRLFTP